MTLKSIENVLSSKDISNGYDKSDDIPSVTMG